VHRRDQNFRHRTWQTIVGKFVHLLHPLCTRHKSALELRSFLTFLVKNIICWKCTFLLSIFKLTPNTQNTVNPHEFFFRNALWNVSCQMVPAQDNCSEVRHIYLLLAQFLSKNGTNFPFNPIADDGQNQRPKPVVM
jgi:hypothetical protein